MAKENVETTFTGVGQTTDWISANFQNQDGFLNVGLDIDSDWNGMVLLEKRYDSE